MTMLAIISALIVERIVGHLPEWTAPRVLRSYLAVWHRLLPFHRLWASAAAIPLLLAPPLALTLYLQSTMREPVPELLFSTLALILCLGPRDISEDVRRWLEAREAGDVENAEQLGNLLKQGPGRYDDAYLRSRNLLGSLFIQSHERLFGVLLWFLVLGPVGAVFYRVVSRLPKLMAERKLSPKYGEIVHSLAAWITARLTAVLYGLAGSLDDSIREYRRLANQTMLGWRGYTWALLAEVASGSIEFESKDGATEVPATLELAVQEVLRLQFRALMILLAGVAAGVVFA